MSVTGHKVQVTERMMVMPKVKTKGWAVTFKTNTAKEKTVTVQVGGPVRALRKARKKAGRDLKDSKMITLVRLSSA